LPFFYCPAVNTSGTAFELDEQTSRHCIQVLRMQPGAQINLTDGRGLLATAVITHVSKKQCTVSVTGTEIHPAAEQKNIMAISLLKNTGRFEWFLEKAAELGITEIVPLVCTRTEKQQFRLDRMLQILISAMLQSRQVHLVQLHAPNAFSNALVLHAQAKKFMAHCYPNLPKENLAAVLSGETKDRMVFIGPEGDFTPQEVEMAIAEDFIPVSLGSNRNGGYNGSGAAGDKG
jgi:16S rRNA (uracil1498-N3)-methyltransferase